MEQHRIFTTPPEIFRAGGAQRVQVTGKKFLLEADFAITVTVDGVLEVIAKFGETIRFETPEDRQHDVVFGFPIGFGVDGAGALVQAEVLGFHAVTMLTVTGERDLWPEPLDPRKLPSGTILLQTLLAVGHGSNIGTNHLEADFRFPTDTIAGQTSRRPNIIWLTGVGVSRELLTSFPAPAAQYCYEYQLQGGAIFNAADTAFVWVGKGSTVSWHVNVPLHKIPLRSLFQSWAAEVPAVRSTVWASPDAGAATVVIAAFDFHYIPTGVQT